MTSEDREKRIKLQREIAEDLTKQAIALAANEPAAVFRAQAVASQVAGSGPWRGMVATEPGYWHELARYHNANADRLEAGRMHNRYTNKSLLAELTHRAREVTTSITERQRTLEDLDDRIAREKNLLASDQKLQTAIEYHMLCLRVSGPDKPADTK